MIDLARILRTVVDTLEQTQIGYVVVGSTAAAAWGVARATRDIDIAYLRHWARGRTPAAAVDPTTT